MNENEALYEGLEVQELEDGLKVVEPDVLVDISSVAACFQDYGHHPLTYLINRLKPSANTQPILLGNFAGTALDDIIHQADADFGQMLRTSFSEQALQFCTCKDFKPEQFKMDAQHQVENIRQSVEQLFVAYDRKRALLEPSFVCRKLGLRGRVDLMTDDLQLLVEQKSGKKWVTYKDAHFAQVLLYYGVLRYNFQLQAEHVDIRLLYSKYPPQMGLLTVDHNEELFREAIRVRNQIVALEFQIARKGFASVLPLLQEPDVLLQQPQKSTYFNTYIRPQTERDLYPLLTLSAQEQQYVDDMITFVYREQLTQCKEGDEQGLYDLKPIAEEPFDGERVVLQMPELAMDEEIEFRRGDIVYLFRYEGEPDVCANILYKGVIEQLTEDRLTIRLSEPQHHPHAFDDGVYAIEYASTDSNTISAVRSMMAFCRASQDRRDLLMGLREPRRDESQQLSHSYHPAYDGILLQAKQACDYYLLQGPPGTGKTSMALRFLVEEEAGTMLLTAYTHRAVDEICAMLEDSGQDYLLLGHEAACDPRFAHRLLSHAFNEQPKLSVIRQRLKTVRIIVSTTMTLQARPFLLQLKHFSLCIVDEASQILEPNIIGLLASRNIDRFILIGDHKQLPAVIQQPDDEPRLHHCRQSLFERLLNQERTAGRTAFTGILNHQGRMHPDIAAFPNEMFYIHEQIQPVPCPHQLETTLDYPEPSQDELDDQLKQHRVLFLPTQVPALPTSELSSVAEARQVADLLCRIYRQIGASHFDADHTVGVIVTYRHQIAKIRREITKSGILPLLDISIDTVERYQGSQRDIIIYALGVKEEADLDFLTAQCFQEDGHTIDRKLNVAMTRARKQLLMIGLVDVLRRDEIFKTLIDKFSI